MHFTSTAHSSSDKGFSLTEVSVMLGIISVLTMGVCWTMEQATHVMLATEARLRSQMSHVVITFPSDGSDLVNPSLVRVTWDWWKADGDADEPILYSPLYSRDDGRNWQSMIDDSPARPGTVTGIDHLTSHAAYDWSVPAERFPEGNYIIRIEAFKDEAPLHYATAQYKTSIKR